jgi:hypothetical protein
MITKLSGLTPDFGIGRSAAPAETDESDEDYPAEE